jgi:hypothetical protein
MRERLKQLPRASEIARRRAVQAGAPLSWTSERMRARKAAADERQPQRAERAIL